MTRGKGRTWVRPEGLKLFHSGNVLVIIKIFSNISNEIRNLRRLNHIFPETSHHRNIPFWAKKIPYLEGGSYYKAKRLKFFLPTPRNFCNLRPTLAVCVPETKSGSNLMTEYRSQHLLISYFKILPFKILKYKLTYKF